MRHILATAMFTLCLSALAETVALPPAQKTGGMPLLEAMSKRASARDFSAEATLTQQELSDILWCANGFNRDDKRTAPSAVNAQAVDIYVFDAEGIWLFNPKKHSLELVVHGDFRDKSGMQPYVKNATVNLIYVYDKSRWPMKGGTDGRWASADAAFCAENVYLYCASAGLKTVVRGSFPEKELRSLLKLPENKLIALAQSIGK